MKYVVRNAFGHYHTGVYLAGKTAGERSKSPGLAAEFDSEREAAAHCEQSSDRVQTREAE